MITVFTRASNNQPISLNKQIASSGEGEVFRIQHYQAKLQGRQLRNLQEILCPRYR